MPKTKAKKLEATKSTAGQLSSIIKACRDIMRKDKGLNGDADRLPMLTWIMFLKFLDDMEKLRDEEAKLAGEKYAAAIKSPYRWRDWAAKEDGITGEDLIRFINNDECVRPDGSRGQGLFAYLRSLEGTGKKRDRRNVISTVFRGTVNRMINGYLLRDVINKINNIHFNSSEEIHTLSFLYESLLKEMRDSAGDGGEFYTPRAVVKFMVTVTNPRLEDIVLDPACGTGGFLTEAFEHIKKQCKRTEDYRTLQETIFGGEAKPLPYLLCQMNLFLHGLDSPQIDPGNSLRKALKDIRDEERVDVILTNPPFGGEEEKGIQGNFPQDRQTAETALLFLQLIMKKMRKPGYLGKDGGQAAVIVPNGTLFGDGVCARIKEDLLKEFNLHTIVRLPNGVFSPYTNIQTNILFFKNTGKPTKDIWYYEHPLPEGRKNYTKTQPIQFEEFNPCIEWWEKRKENEQAWKIAAKDILKYSEKDELVSVNLDIKNPKSGDDFEHMPPEQLIDDVLEKEHKIIEIMKEIKEAIQIK